MQKRKNQKNKNDVEADELSKSKQKNRQEKINDDAARMFDDVLENDETIQLCYKPSMKKAVLISLLKPLIIFMLFIAAITAIYFLKMGGLSKNDVLVVFYFLLCLFVLLEVYMLISTIKFVKNNFLIITKENAIMSNGFIGVDFKRLKNQDIIDVFFKFGKIYIKTKDEYIVFGNTCKPRIIVNELQEYLGLKND